MTKLDKQAQLRCRPVIRIFVSSTFSDLKQERNALQAQVFPRLEQLCAQNGFQFQAIDLRWGVSGEAGLDHRTMRYGWRPLPEGIHRSNSSSSRRPRPPAAKTRRRFRER
jgi:hypothetical protein